MAIPVSRVTPRVGSSRVALGQLPAVALSAQDEDFGVVDEPIGNGGSHGGRIEDIAPVGKG